MSESPALTAQARMALDRFTLEVAFDTTHQVTGLFGPSGAGKSSLLEALAGLRRSVAGFIRLGNEVWLDSKAKRRLPPERRDIGYVPQDGLFFPHRNVKQNLLAGRRRAEHNGHRPAETLHAVSHLLGLEPLWRRDVTTLSGGERQRVALGRAICSGPRLLLLDEPLASLDLPLRRRLLPFLRRIREEFRIPMILVSHDPLEVQALCDDLIVLREGALVSRGAPHAVLSDPRFFSLAAEEGFETLLRGTLARSESDTSLVLLGPPGNPVPLVTARIEASAGSPVLVSIPSRDVILATERPAGVSACNVLPATIEAVHAEGEPRLVTAVISEGIPSLTIEITETARRELSLERGRSVYLLIKGKACRVTPLA
ncbi:MAG: molybdenum ABC transporter ATP-binding protein [Planctomycetota bacterium]